MVPRNPDDADLPEIAYACWLGAGGRHVADVARLLDLPRTTVQSWHDRYRWRERADSDDRELVASVTGDAWRKLALGLPRSIQRFLDGIGWQDAALNPDCDDPECYTDDDGPALPPPDKDETKRILAHLAMFGITPQRTLTLRAAPSVAARVSDADLDALDTAALIALAMGQPLPALPPPGDFPSGQPGGRVVPGPTPPVSDTVDADWRETAEPDPIRVYAPGGEDYVEFDQEP